MCYILIRTGDVNASNALRTVPRPCLGSGESVQIPSGSSVVQWNIICTLLLTRHKPPDIWKLVPLTDNRMMKVLQALDAWHINI